MKKFVFAQLFAVVAVSTVLGADYDDVLGRYKIWPMASAAYGNQPNACVNDNFANATFRNQYTVQCDVSSNDTCSGFLAISHSDKAIILSFRGSQGALQLLIEDIGGLFSGREPFVGGGTVDKYFLDGFNKIWTAGMKNDLVSAKHTYPDYELWVTGHSLGGAMASVAAATIGLLGYVSPDKIKLITYGQPRTGDSDYAADVDNTIPYVFRIIHAHDIVAHLPTEKMGYQHHKAEAWYNNNMAAGSAYTVCDADEGKGCSDGSLDLSTDDHMKYFNLNVDFAANGCPGYNPHR